MKNLKKSPIKDPSFSPGSDNKDEVGPIAKKSKLQHIIYDHSTSDSTSQIDHSLFKLERDGSLYWMQYKDPEPSRKIAAFDLDNTLTVSIQKGENARLHGRWRMFTSETIIQTKIMELHQSGYKIVIFSNQFNLPPRKSSWEAFLRKLKLLLHYLDVPIQVFIATEKDMYRKPSTGMWEYLVKHCNAGSQSGEERIEIDVINSFFVGDAAGRTQGWKQGMSVDFSDSDRKFAMSIGLPFHTPEEYFLGEPKAKFQLNDDKSPKRKSSSAKSDLPKATKTLKAFGFA